MESSSKDFLEQLRTVHFTLAVLCVTSVVVVNLPSSTMVSRAANDVDQIVKTTEPWNRYLLEDAAGSVAQGHGECRQNLSFSLVLNGQPAKVVITRMWDLDYPEVPAGPDDAFRPALAQPVSLTQFKRLWDSQGTLQCPAEGSRPTQIDGYLMSQKAFLDWHFPVANATTGNPKFFLFLSRKTLAGWPGEPGALLMQMDQKDDRFVIHLSPPTPVSVERVRARTQLIKKLPDYPDADFVRAFPDLAAMAVGKEDGALTSLKEFLHQRQSNDKEVFEAFGIKIPIDSAAGWAMILMLAVQAYLWIHLSEYYRRKLPESDVAWIGVYPSVAAKAMSVATFVVAPAAVSAYLAYKQGLAASWRIQGLYHWLALVALTASVALSVVTGVTYLKNSRQ